MNLTKQVYQYNSFGLNITSEICFPELFVTTFNGCGDVQIGIGNLTELWNKKVTSNSQVFVEKNLVLFKIPNLSIFCIKNSNSIIFSPELGADQDKIRLYLLGTCMGTLLLQKKILCLHGSAVAIDGKAYAFVGDSGAGKSTIAAAFALKNFQLISDDVIAINFDNQDKPLVMPSYPQQKLWEESLICFGMNSINYKPLFERETKYAVPVKNPIIVPIPLAGIIELSAIENESSIRYESLDGLHRVQTLFQHTYRSSFIRRLKLSDWHFRETVKLINRIQMSKLSRPTQQFTVHEMVSIVLKNI
ncbi:aldolase [Fictibacillus arsenicus]|uniref:Aldolase n=1 Tax=Fictibacillus arsenicus TaxID=255247 RepID=A0A1V3GD24_9BACL|nr:aldolase [Fictibacillus arsenicus]OOE14602.1 aldolase [Fictibacillus arsenicus]